MFGRFVFTLALVTSGVALSCRTAPPAAQDEWQAYGRDGTGTRYLDGSITPDNVARLKPAWTYHTGETSFDTNAEKKSAFEATPILVDGTLYLSTPFNAIIALDPLSGRERWRFDPHLHRNANYYSEVTSRGVATWLDTSARADALCRRRIIEGTIDGRLIAVDAKDGVLCQDFGDGGFVDLTRDIGRLRMGDYQVTSPPAVAGDLIIVGSSIGDNGAVELERGVVRAYDARTGHLRWSWDPIPREAHARRQEAWRGERPISTGAANAWAGISVDAARGLVFVPTSAPSPDYYGGERLGTNAHANSVVALRAESGELVWSFQVVHHDLWDYDVASQPMLVSVSLTHGGPRIDALAVGTKMAHLFLLNRETGKPIFPVEERPVPPSDVPGEEAWPTQPFPIWPPPLVPQRLRPEDAWGISDADREACRQAIASMRSEGVFTPPAVRGTVVMPSNVGGMNWGGMSYDERQRVLVVNTNNIPVAVRLIPRERFAEERRGGTNNRLGGEFASMSGTPFGMYREILTAPSGVPCNAPPWGTLTAIDLDAAKVLWTVPLGTTPRFSSIPGAHSFGSINLGGTIVTGGVIFVAAAMDEMLRAFDVMTGKLLWEHALPASAQATPMTYRAGGRQYVVIAAGGHGKLGTKRGDAVVAFALSP